MKLGIAGAGKIVQEFLTIADKIENLECAAIFCTRKNEEEKRALQKQYNIESLFFDYDELLNSDIDTVYVALPNNLHFEFARKALEAGKNVIIEKPITVTYKQAEILSDIAKERRLFIFEAITNQYLPNYKKIKELIPQLGKIKIVQCNYSQYSSRYDKFKEGIVLPAFDPKFAGGALMDLNIYNIHYVVGLFGKPEKVEYYPNIERNIDTSGILMLDYGKFKCVCIGAKDCKAPVASNIQGDNGCIHVDTPVNVCEKFELILNDGSSKMINENNMEHRMMNEFIEFVNMVENEDYKKCYEMLEHSLIVCQVAEEARKKGGVVFPGDDE